MALIRLMPIEPKLDFLGKRLLFMVFSAFLMLASIGAFLTQGLNFGVDFRGGILMEVETEQPADLGQLRAELGDLGLGEITLQGVRRTGRAAAQHQPAGGRRGRPARGHRAGAADPGRAGRGVSPHRVRRPPRWAPSCARPASWPRCWRWPPSASTSGLRFEWQFGPGGADRACARRDRHGGASSAVTQIEFNLATLAAVLTIAGYSINGHPWWCSTGCARSCASTRRCRCRICSIWRSTRRCRAPC